MAENLDQKANQVLEVTNYQLNEWMRGTGSPDVVTIHNHLNRLHEAFGNQFDPLRALDNLIETAQGIRRSIAKDLNKQ